MRGMCGLSFDSNTLFRVTTSLLLMISASEFCLRSSAFVERRQAVVIESFVREPARVDG
jgi:hypothetical protein